MNASPQKRDIEGLRNVDSMESAMSAPPVDNLALHISTSERHRVRLAHRRAVIAAAPRPRPGPMARIIAQVAKRHGLTPHDLTGPSRRRRVAWPRQEAFALCRALPHQPSFAAIGRAFGGRDHATIVNGIRAHTARQAAPQ